VEMHPHDAAESGVRTGDWVRVSSRRGAVLVRALITTRSPQGTVFLPFHFAEAAANLLTLDRIDGRAKIPDYKNTAVKIEKAETPAGLDEGYELPLFDRGAIKDPVQIH
jgi:predicted molibdopterin-dependent oxidoreductase YjgC